VKILFTGKNHSQGLKDLDPASLAGTAQSLGHSLVHSLDDYPDVVICVDFDRSVLPLIGEANSMGIRTVLIANEPEVVIPEHSQAKVLRKFARVLKVGRPETRDRLNWPQTWIPIAENQDRLDRVVLVNADKWSFVRGQHYWLRAAASSRLENVDVFGYGWGRPLFVRLAHRAFELSRTIASGAVPSLRGVTKVLTRPKNYQGSIVDKNMALSRYKVALVVENSSELLTEKLFDALFAGCLPVYVGPDVDSFGIPSSLVVQVGAPTLRNVEEAVNIALNSDREFFLEELQRYIDSGVDAEWAAENALMAILEQATKPL
jgi:hypothetical protein